MEDNIQIEPSKEPYYIKNAFNAATAKAWLDKYNTSNREIDKAMRAKIDGMKRDIYSGNFTLNHQAIALSPNNILIDGQSRLTAISECDRTVMLWVQFNAPDDGNIDKGVPRSRIGGLIKNGLCTIQEKNKSQTLEKMVNSFGAPRKLTDTEFKALFTNHRTAIDFAHNNIIERRPKINGIVNMNTRAVIARAYYSVETNRLADFCFALSTGVVRSGVDVITRLVQELGKNSAKGRYANTESALNWYVRSHIPDRWTVTTKELFPLPEERR